MAAATPVTKGSKKMHLQVDAATTLCGRHDFDLDLGTTDAALVDCPQCVKILKGT